MCFIDETANIICAATNGVSLRKLFTDATISLCRP